MTRRLLIAGMPNSGKSTFIAALRYLITSREAETALEQTRLSDNEAHFNKLEERWLDGRRVERTQKPSEAWVSLHVRDRETGVEADLNIPDLRGERFEQPAAAGLCERGLYDALANAEGFMLFTNADAGVDDMMISDVDDVARALEGERVDAEGEVARSRNEGGPQTVLKPPRFNPYEMPEEAKVVELLQMMNRRPLAALRRKLVVVISAWDAVEAVDDASPDDWLARNRPMLHQFLKYNPELWMPRTYGVSAQGGALPRDKDKLLQMKKPAHRIRIVGHGAAQHDLTAPIRWLMASGEP